MHITKNLFVACLFVMAFALFGASQALANVTITAASGGGAILADTAADAPAPAWTSLGPITIAEGIASDYGAGTGVTLVLKAPSGFEFNTAVTPSVTYTAGRNITNAAVEVSDASTLTITLSVSGTGSLDSLSIGSTTALQVRPAASTPLATGKHIYRPTSGGGTATIAGITANADGAGGSNFGNLTETGGAVTQLAFTTQPAGATAGAAFSTQPAVKSRDQFGNNSTNGLPANAFVTVSLTAGTGTLVGTTNVNLGMSAGKGTATYSGLRIDVAGTDKQLTATSTNGLTSALSSVFTVNPAAANKLVMATQPSASAIAGVPFADQPVVQILDAYNNLRSSDTLTITATRNAGAGALLGTTSVAAVGGIATYTDLAHTLATNITIRFTSGSLTAATSGVVAVSAGSLTRLLVLLPGETYTPGSVTGKSGTPTALTAGTPFTVRVVAVDAGFNQIASVTDTVGITSSESTAILPPSAALINGTNAFTVTSVVSGTYTITATDLTDGITTGTSATATVNAGAFTKLQLLMPGEVAAPGTPTGKTGTPAAQTAGTAFTVTVNGVDANWNVVPSANGSAYTIRITSSDSYATLPADANLASGTRTFSVTFKTAGTATLTATDVDDGTKTPSTSPATTVNVGAFTKLQLLVPGETAVPGSTSGKTGTPSAQNVDNLVVFTVNAVDANWNLVSTVTDTVGITSSDANAGLPAQTALVGGTQSFPLKFNTAGTRTITASDVTDGTKTANTSPSITVAVGVFAKLQVLMPGETAAPGTVTGKTGTPTAQAAGTAFNVTIRSVDASWNLISTNDTTTLTSSDAQAVLPANGALSLGSRTASVTFRTSGAQTVTAANVTHPGVASDTGSATVVNPAAASKLVIASQPSATATAGVPFVQQPVIYIQDTYNNVRSNDTLVVTATRIAGAGTLLGTTNLTAVGGVAAFTDLAHGYATNITIRFSSGALTTATSDVVAVSPDIYSRLLVLAPGQTNAPGTVSGVGGTAASQTAGNAFVVRVMASDAYGNVLTTPTNEVAITSSDTNAVLPANAALINGTNAFSITCIDAGSQTVTASDVTDGVTTGTSSAITVNGGVFTKLQLLLPGETAAPGTPTGKTGTPIAQTAGTQFSVTVNAVDANWNVVSSTHTVSIATTDPNDTHPSNGALSAGTRTFNVTFKTAGTWTLTATDVTDGTKTASTSPSVTAAVGAFTKLQLLMPGETAAPGTSTGKTGTPLGQNTDSPFMVTVNAVDANWNLVDSVTDIVATTASDPNAALSPQAALVAGTQTFAIKFNTAGNRTVTASDITDGAKTANTSPTTAVSAGALAKLQILMPGEVAAPGTMTGKTGAPTVRTAGTSFTITVSAVDTMWNIVASNHTVGFTSSDAFATLPANTALGTDGTASFNSPVFKTAGTQTITVSDVTSGLVASATSAEATVNPGTFSKLQLLVPGETAVPGSSTGKTGSPSTQTAGTAFTFTVNSVDANWNPISTNDIIRITSTDTNAVLPANAALVAGTQTFGVTLVKAPGATITAADVTHTGATANTSPSIPVAATTAALVRVETKADGTGVIVPAQNVSAGSSITNYAIARDTYGNFVANVAADAWSLINMTGGVVEGDLVPAPDGLSAIFTAHVTGTASIHVSSGALVSTDSGLLTARAGAFAKLLLLMPGETTAPGTATGKTGTPDAQTAGVGYSITVNGVDAYWNLTTNANGTSYTVRIASTDTNATLPADANLAFGTRTFALTNKTAGSRTITASDVDDGTKTPSVASITVNPAAFAKLQLLVPGETAAPGSASGKIGTPTPQTAGTAFNASVNAVDAYWNLIASVVDTVAITCTDTNATLPADAALVNGSGTFALTLKTSGSRTVTATDLTDGTKTANTSPAITVNVGAFTKLQLLVPGETAAPGTASGKTGTPTAQVAGTAATVRVNAVDENWNVVSSTHSVGITTTDPNDTHPSNGALSAGTRTFSVTFRTVGDWTVTATDITDGTKVANISPIINVTPGALAKLQLLVPGETAAPGTTTGKTGTPSAQSVGAAFDVIVNAVDANWNRIATNDTVRLTSSDASATLPANAALVAGTQTLGVTLNTAGSFTLTAANVTHTGVTANTSPSITVAKGDQTIAFAPLSSRTYGEAAFALSATASSGLPVSFSIVSGPATVLGSTLSITGAGDVTVRAAQAGNANWNAATNVEQSFNVAQTTLVVGGVDQTRPYGAANPVLTVAYVGFVNGDTAASLTGSPAVSTLAETNSPTGPYAVEVSLGSLASANYSFSFTNGTLTVTPTTLTVKADDKSRAYGANNPELTVSYTGFVNGQDTNILTGAPDIATTADAGSPAASYPITVTAGTLAVSDTNYALAFVGGTLTVNPAALTVTADAAAKVYGDADPALTYQITSGALVNSDSLSGSLARVTGESVGAYAIEQNTLTAGTNYSLTYLGANLTITNRPLSITANSQGKVYGQEVTFTGTEFTASGLAAGETVTSVTLTSAGAAATAAVTGSPYAIVPSNPTGIEAANYAISYVNGSLTVSQAPVTVTGITADSKPYDGNTSATIHTEAATLQGQVSGDDVTLNTSGATGAFADAFVGTGKTVYITGLTLDGASAGNYALTQPTTTADISSASVLTVVGIEASNKVYDGTTTATLNVTGAALVGVIGGDDVSLDVTNAAGAFLDKNIGTGKTVQVTGLALLGADAAKYTLTQPTTNADITAVALTVTEVTADNKAYDGNTTAALSGTAALSAGVVGSEDVALAGTPVASFNTKDVGMAKPVTVSGYTLAGADIANYTLSQPAGLSADITAVTLTVTGITADNKVYDGTTAATLNTGSAALAGSIVSGEDVTLDTGNAVGAFASSDVGTEITVTVSGLTLSGADAGNYTLTQPTTAADITRANSATALASSQNPSTQGASVTFTATVTPIAPASATPTGSVQFYNNGLTLGSPVSLVDGVASLSTSDLPTGTNIVGAAYLGEGNFDGSTNSVEQVVNAIAQTPITLGLVNNGDGTVTVTFSGTPGAEYLVQASIDLGSPASWTSVSTNTAGIDGQWSFTDSTTAQPVRFYRSAKP